MSTPIPLAGTPVYILPVVPRVAGGDGLWVDYRGAGTAPATPCAPPPATPVDTAAVTPVVTTTPVVTVCGSGQGGVGSPCAPPPTTPVVTASGTPVVTGTVILTQADNGRTIVLSTGQHLELVLAGEASCRGTCRWTIPRCWRARRCRSRPAYRPSSRAAAPGQTTLRAVGTPLCASAAPCTLQAAVFSVALIVQ